MSKAYLEHLSKPLENEKIEHWIYRNKNEIFKIHLKNENLTWKKISIEVSSIFNLKHTLRASDFIYILNSDFWFSLNQKNTMLRQFPS